MRPLIDWSGIDLVVFDVDGTLYDARRLRLAMGQRLLASAWRDRSFRTLRVLRAFRDVREALGDEGCADFMTAQYTRTAAQVRCGEDEVRALTLEWMERQPLGLLRACRHERVADVFDALRRTGRRIAVLSDYPAIRKLHALQLRADLVVSATDPEITRLKPDPCGLHAILRRTGVPASRTLMIGDRIDRDAAVARRAGTHALILSSRRHAGVPVFSRYDAPVFKPLFESPALL